MPAKPDIDIVRFAIGGADHAFRIEINPWLVGLIGLGLLIWIVAHRCLARGSRSLQMELDEAEFGIGDAKFTLRPNLADRQVAYAVWVELSTRKVGLPIDFDHDVLIDVYESWYSFFAVTRELVKTIPISRVGNTSTRQIIRLSIDVLNEGLRPHLTNWYARFRRWYDQEAAKAERANDDPQDIQRDFGRWADLVADMERVNQRLIRYRQTMHQVVYGDPPAQNDPAAIADG